MADQDDGVAKVEERAALTTTEKLAALGYPPDARLLIVNGDDLGMCHAANVATFDALEHGLVTSASLMLCCPWAFDAIQRLCSLSNPDVGVHLTLTAEWRAYRWGPILGAARCPSLVDQDGFFHARPPAVHAQAAMTEAQAEVEAQLQRAYAWGLDPSHVDDHMGTLSTDRRYLALAIETARRHRLPLRLSPSRRRAAETAADAAMPLDLSGLMTLDDIRNIPLRDPASLQAGLLENLRSLRPGVTELVLHAALPTPEAQAIMPDWQARAEAYRLVRQERAIAQLADDLGIVRIGWHALRAAQRAR